MPAHCAVDYHHIASAASAVASYDALVNLRIAMTALLQDMDTDLYVLEAILGIDPSSLAYDYARKVSERCRRGLQELK